MQKLTIKPKPMSVQQAVRIFDALNYTGKKVFYKTLSDDEKDALYIETTDDLIAKVHLTTKNRIDAKTNRTRNGRCGYIVPDECHRAENECLWRSAAWYILMGRDIEVFDSLPHMHPHFQALRNAQGGQHVNDNPR